MSKLDLRIETTDEGVRAFILPQRAPAVMLGFMGFLGLVLPKLGGMNYSSPSILVFIFPGLAAAAVAVYLFFRRREIVFTPAKGLVWRTSPFGPGGQKGLSLVKSFRVARKVKVVRKGHHTSYDLILEEDGSKEIPIVKGLDKSSAQTLLEELRTALKRFRALSRQGEPSGQ
jgi:hypothetical protein